MGAPVHTAQRLALTGGPFSLGGPCTAARNRREHRIGTRPPLAGAGDPPHKRPQWPAGPCEADMRRAFWRTAAGIHALAIVVNAYALAVSGSKVCAAMIGLSVVLGAHVVTKARKA